LVDSAHPEAALYPTHGFGSFCSIGPASHQESSTIGEQATANHALTDPNEDHFVSELLANITAYPAYYAHMSPLNAAGVGPAQLDVPDSVDAEELGRRLKAGEWVVDLRHRVAFADGHLQGSVSFEYGRGDNFTSYLGWVIPWNQPLTLLGPLEEVEKAIRDLARIGIDSPDAAVGPHARILDVGALAPDVPQVEPTRTGTGLHSSKAVSRRTWCWMFAGRKSSRLPTSRVR
jgi:hydroxyacylglutathione hydrolase